MTQDELRQEATKPTKEERAARGWVRTTIYGCAICGGEHKEMVFTQRPDPEIDSDGTTWTHEAECPTSGEILLLRVAPAIPRRENPPCQGKQ